VHSFLDRSGLATATVGDAPVQPAGSDLLRLLRERVTDSEWAESGFAGDDVANAWVVVDENDWPMAASNLTPFDGVPPDVGVLAGPAVRGRGVATMVAATAARYAVERHGIVRWRAVETNAASRRLAKKLGFEDDCVQFAVRSG
jgi:RimJ/RimL family protein N-acetyltransferase